MMLRRTCRDVAALLIAREDRALPLSDRVAVRLHLMACDACPDFERQLQLMRRALRHWREDPAGEDEAGAGDAGAGGPKAG